MFGAHLSRSTVVEDVNVSTAEVVQVFVSNPRGYQAPSRSIVETLRALGDMPVYAHLPYLVNPASADPAVREKSRALIAATDGAGSGILAGVVIHAGQGGPKASVDEAIDRWIDSLTGLELSVPLLVENTAGGNAAPGRRSADLATLVGRLRDLGLPTGTCFDTCHAFAAGEEDLVAGFETLKAALGRVDLVHLNDSRDPLNSARDRHELLGKGTIGWDALTALAATASVNNTPVILETPGDPAVWRDELNELRARIAHA